MHIILCLQCICAVRCTNLNKDKQLIKVVTGIRRCGKSTLFELYKEYLINQVALTVRDENTLKRELTPLDNISDHNPKYLLTLDDDPPTSHNGIRQLNALEWLLKKAPKH